MIRIRSLCLFVFLLLGATRAHATFLDCLFAGDFENPGTTDVQPLAAVQAHNCARRTVVPAASSPIAALAWSSPVATIAQTYSDLCNYAHSMRPGYGENIYAAASTDPNFAATMKDAVLAWSSEQPYYNYANNTCSAPSPPGTCGHYTQVVWDTTSQVGCGLTRCTQNSPFGDMYPTWYFVVCNYLLPGNDGSKPY